MLIAGLAQNSFQFFAYLQKTDASAAFNTSEYYKQNKNSSSIIIDRMLQIGFTIELFLPSLATR